MRKLRKQKKDPIKRLKWRADDLLQVWFRREFPEEKCLLCGRPAELRHHFILKSRSNRLRYCEDNLIPVCKACHSKCHFGYENAMGAKIGAIRGIEWVKRLEELSKEHLVLTRKYLEEIIEKYY